MEDVPYEDWAKYIEEIFKINNFTCNSLLDLGCGTGSICSIFAKKGYEVIGVDLSQDMLSIANEKAYENNLNILYLNQDMTEFELYGTVDTILSLCDSLNYILEEEELLHTFTLVNNYLNPNGLFIFDLNTEYKFKDLLSNNVFAESKEKEAYIWENFYDEDEKINIYTTNFFIKDEKSNLYERVEEVHYQKAYDIEKVSELLKKAGLKLLNVYDAFTLSEPNEKSERIYFVAMESGKVNKEEK